MSAVEPVENRNEVRIENGSREVIFCVKSPRAKADYKTKNGSQQHTADFMTCSSHSDDSMFALMTSTKRMIV